MLRYAACNVVLSLHRASHLYLELVATVVAQQRTSTADARANHHSSCECLTAVHLPHCAGASCVSLLLQVLWPAADRFARLWCPSAAHTGEADVQRPQMYL